MAGARRDGAPAVLARDLSKVFKLYERPSGRLVEWLTLGRVRRHEPYPVLKDITLEAAPGECLGIIGRNGCGKSTLLRILSGSLSPTSGTVSIRGRVFALIELSTGFNSTLTGEQNIDFAAQMLGMDRNYVRSKKDQIIDFADLGRYIDRPLREYSSGMRSRLSFSMFAFLEPDVLMVDEAFSVGDEAFQKKSYALLEEMITAEGRTVLFVSHAMHVMRRLCQRVAWLEDGGVRLQGSGEEVCDAYLEHMRRHPSRGQHEPAIGPSGVPLVPEPFREPAHSVGGFAPTGGEPSLAAMWIVDAKGAVLPTAPARAPFRIHAAYRFERPAPACAFVMRLHDEQGWLVAHSDTRVRDGAPPVPSGRTTIVTGWQFKPIGLAPGRYRVSVEALPLDERGEVAGPPLLTVEEAGMLEVEGPRVVDSVYDGFLPPGLVEHHDDQ